MKWYGATFMILQGFGGGYKGRVWVVWRVGINIMWSRESIVIVYVKGSGFR